jgi:TRAP-type C4-dicarboxylate transport system permease small subunit
MAGSATVLSDSSVLSRLDRLLLPLERIMAICSGLAAFSLMFLAAWSVTGRKFFASPLPGYVDIIMSLMPLIAIFGISYVQREGGHIRMDILVGALKGRILFVELLTVLLIIVLMIGLVWGSWSHFDRSFDCARPLCSRDSTIDLSLPLWPSKLVVPIALAVLTARLILQAVAYARALVLGLDTPVAVPLVQSIEAQAMAEAKQLEGGDQ